MDKLQLLSSVKRLRILQDCTVSRQPISYHTFPWFSAKDAQSLVRFSAFTNIQELGVDELNLGEFAPRAQLCFGSFAQNLRLLALRLPRGSSQQLLCFLGLFPNIDDLKLVQYYPDTGSPPNPALVPQSALSLRGRLTLEQSTAELFLRDLSGLIGGLRFRHMNLQDVGCKTTQFLLNACPHTLETFRVPPACVSGKGFFRCRGFLILLLSNSQKHLICTVTSPFDPSKSQSRDSNNPPPGSTSGT